MQTDNEICRELRQDNKQALESLFRFHYASLCSYAFTFLKEQEASEEIVQDLFCKIWETRSEIEVDSFKRYLLRAVHNSCLNQIKHINIREEYKEAIALDERSDETPVSIIENDELSVRIQTEISKLPIERQRIFRMSRFEELKYREIAEELNLSVKTVENQMGKALKFLREQLSDLMPVVVAGIAGVIKLFWN